MFYEFYFIKANSRGRGLNRGLMVSMDGCSQSRTINISIKWVHCNYRT